MKAKLTGSLLCNKCGYVLLADLFEEIVILKCANPKCEKYNVMYQAPILTIERLEV